MRALSCRWLTLSAALYAVPAVGQPNDAELPVKAALDWQRTADAESCIDRDQLEQAVEERLQRQVFVEQNHDVVLFGRTSRGADGTWTVELRLTGAEGQPMGTRVLQTQAEDCSSLDDSLALVLAVMLDIPKAEVPEPEVVKPRQPETPTPAAPKRPPPRSTPLRVPKDTPARREPWRVEVAAGVEVTSGLLPKASPGIGVRALVSPPRFWTLGFEALALKSVDATLSGADAGANFSPRSLGLWVCPGSFDLDLVEARVCLVEHVGRLHVEGFGFDDNQKTTRTYVNPGLRFDAFRSLVGPLGVSLTLGLDVPMVRETFRYGDPAGENPQLFRMEPVVLFAQIGLAARF